MQDISLEQAVEVLLEQVGPVRGTERVPLMEALGRTLAEDFAAPFDNPPFDRSPLDGYTFDSRAVASATPQAPARLRIIGEECAGQFFDRPVPRGCAVRIMTGGAIPSGCDCVVRQEDVAAEGDTLSVPLALHHLENYCFAGEDIRRGTMLMRGGTKITAAHLAVLASMGCDRVNVIRPVRIALASTGDELLQPGEPLRPGRIYNSNLYLLAGRLREMGFAPKILGILPDDCAEAAGAVQAELDQSDLILTTGGVSVGKKDIMHGVVRQIGRRLFWRVCMKPGAPAIAYTADETLGIALSGNPFAACATFELLVRPVLAKLSGRDELLVRRVQAVLTNGFSKPSPGRRFIRAYYEAGKVRIPEQHASGSLFSAVGCNAFVEIPAGTGPLEPGTKVGVVLL